MATVPPGRKERACNATTACRMLHSPASLPAAAGHADAAARHGRRCRRQEAVLCVHNRLGCAHCWCWQRTGHWGQGGLAGGASSDGCACSNCWHLRQRPRPLATQGWGRAGPLQPVPTGARLAHPPCAPAPPYRPRADQRAAGEGHEAHDQRQGARIRHHVPHLQRGRQGGASHAHVQVGLSR